MHLVLHLRERSEQQLQILEYDKKKCGKLNSTEWVDKFGKLNSTELVEN